MKKKIAVLVPDGVGIKNYLYTRVFKDVDAELTLYHNFDDETLDEIKKQCDFHQAIRLPDYHEGVREKFLRELIHLARLKYYARSLKNSTILFNWKRKHKSYKLKSFYSAVELAALAVTSYKTILKLERKYRKSLKRNPFFSEVKDLLKQHSPDVLFCTHQRAVNAPAVFQAAGALDIETATVIYSWDNLPKARLALRADKYLVWSDYMKEELRQLYPELKPSQIHVTGTPQFEFYSEEKFRLSKETFYNRYGLDLSKRYICFSGDDVTTSPYDPMYLDDLAGAIKDAGMDTEIGIIFRRCPVDISGRYEEVLKKYPELIVEIEPLWRYNKNRWTAVYPTVEDVELLVNLAGHTELVVNVGSTMAFDFGMFGKPCVFINYDQTDDSHWNVETIYNFQHFRSMPNSESVYWLNDSNEIAEVLRQALNETKNRVLPWFERVVENPNTASEKIYKVLTQ